MNDKQPEALRLAAGIDALRTWRPDDVHRKAAAELRRLSALNAELAEALRRIEPHLDAIVCYASTMDEHEPNRLVVEARAVLAKAEEQQ